MVQEIVTVKKFGTVEESSTVKKFVTVQEVADLGSVLGGLGEPRDVAEVILEGTGGLGQLGNALYTLATV